MVPLLYKNPAVVPPENTVPVVWPSCGVVMLPVLVRMFVSGW